MENPRESKTRGTTPSVFTQFITRGKLVKGKDGKKTRQRCGAVVGIVEDNNLKIGWSLCNNKTHRTFRFVDNGEEVMAQERVIRGDRFDKEQALNLAEGRARNQHSHSLTFDISFPVTKTELTNKGVPQSSLTGISQIVSEAITAGHKIDKVTIFNTKAPVEPKVATRVWTAV